MLNFSFLCILDKAIYAMASELAKYFVSVNRPSFIEHVNAQNVIL